MPDSVEINGRSSSINEFDLSNVDASHIVPATPIARVHKDHPLDVVLGEVNSPIHTRRQFKKADDIQKGFFIQTLRQRNSHTDL